MASLPHIPLLGVLALVLISAQVWRSGTDPISACIAALVIAGVVIWQVLWERPHPLFAAACIVGAIALFLLW